MHNPDLVPKKHSFAVRFGQIPLTHFKDYRKSIQVELLNPESKDSMKRRVYQFVKATWADTPEENENPTEQQMDDALNAMLSGKALQLGLETVKFTFKISGISRIDTHQIVRQRIGVTFSQQCTGDRDVRHNRVLVEESIAQDPELLKEYMNSTLGCKSTYSNMVDLFKVSIQTARTIMPHNLETFIFMNVDLATLLFFHQKRVDDGSQTWQINLVAKYMADRVCEVYPELIPVFERNKTKFQFQREASADRNNSFSTGLYIPKDDEFEYHERDFLYPLKKNEMHFTETPIKDRYFWGGTEVSESEYLRIEEIYNKTNKWVHSSSPSNEDILIANMKSNDTMLDEAIL